MKTGIDPEILEALWRSPENWKWGGIYFCKEDPRVIVPKRQKWMGWTINFARPSAWPTLFALVLFTGAPAFWIAERGFTNVPIYLAIIAGDVLVLCVVCWFLASKKRC
jgi:hypothetical protein